MSPFWVINDVVAERGVAVSIRRVSQVGVVGYDGDWRVEYVVDGHVLRGRQHARLEEAAAERDDFLAADALESPPQSPAETPAA